MYVCIRYFECEVQIDLQVCMGVSVKFITSCINIHVAMPRKSRFFQRKNWVPKRMGKVFLFVNYMNMIDVMFFYRY